MLPENTHKNT